MTEYLPLFDSTMRIFAAVQVGLAFVVFLVVLIHYARRRSVSHIAMVAASYMMLTSLTAGAIIFRIFADSTLRMTSLGVALIAFVLGDYALWRVWHTRDDAEEQQVEVNSRIQRNSERIVALEAKLEMVSGTEAHPVHVVVNEHEWNNPK